MSDAWKELGAVPEKVQTTGPNPRWKRVAQLVKKGQYDETFGRSDLLGAIEHCGLDRKTAANWAAKYLTWAVGWEIAHQAPYEPPPSNTVRKNWKTIPIKYLTDAERKLCQYGGERDFRVAGAKEMPR